MTTASILAEPRPDPRQRLGRAGEAAAERALCARGYEILSRRFRLRFGEIDLVALDGETVVFVEVKTRSGTGYGGAAGAVTPAKQQRLARVALAWLTARGWMERRCRFDVVEVLTRDAAAPRVTLIRDAFRLLT